MTVWMLIVAGTAFGGALIVWHAVSHTKHASEQMLDKYVDLLEKSREKRAELLVEQRRREAEAAAAESAPPTSAPPQPVGEDTTEIKPVASSAPPLN